MATDVTSNQGVNAFDGAHAFIYSGVQFFHREKHHKKTRNATPKDDSRLGMLQGVPQRILKPSGHLVTPSIHKVP
jgi:hypothetical protein